jgi:hypothetical protein
MTCQFTGDEGSLGLCKVTSLWLRGVGWPVLIKYVRVSKGPCFEEFIALMLKRTSRTDEIYL